jgi:uncharacterized membrane protein
MGNFGVYSSAAAIGAVAGLRTFTAPAIVSWAAASGDLRVKQRGLRMLRSAATANTFLVLAAGELIADKTPYIPDRIDAAPLAGRIVSGGLCGAAICSARRESPVAGAILGGLGAVGGAFLGYHLRKHAVRKHHVPDLGAALVEDAVAVGGGLAALAPLK